MKSIFTHPVETKEASKYNYKNIIIIIYIFFITITINNSSEYEVLRY